MQKADTTKASASKVSPQPLSPEELTRLVDISVASKYDTDLAQLTRVLAEDVRHMLDSFRHDLGDNLPRQIRSVVKEVVGNTQGKQAIDVAGTAAQRHTGEPGWPLGDAAPHSQRTTISSSRITRPRPTERRWKCAVRVVAGTVSNGHEQCTPDAEHGLGYKRRNVG
jgi:hypothetical protein